MKFLQRLFWVVQNFVIFVPFIYLLVTKSYNYDISI